MAATTCSAQRTEQTINDAWEFRLPDDAQWQQINIPHTYNLDAYQRRDYYQGKAFYRRTLTLAEVDASKRYYLRFEAASKSCDVIVNGQKAGSHNGGYTAFNIDITPFIQQGDNLIELTTDNSRPDITPISADFTFWGGVYRDVWLITSPLQHFAMDDLGGSGIRITTPNVADGGSSISTSCLLTNDASTPSRVELKLTVTAPDGTIATQTSKRVTLKAGQTTTLALDTKPIANRQLWTPEQPNLYTVTTQLVDAKTGRELDRQSHKTAFRWFAFDGNKGFSLNGQPYKLRGTNRHQDRVPTGVALSDEAHRRDIQLLKEIGSNFIRIAHYPQDKAILDACDELGMLAWEEIPIINIVPDTPGYADNCERNLREMIRNDYNHPSVIAWGYMNEILLTTPRPDKPEWPAVRDRTVALAQRLERVLKEEDPTRSSVMAFNMTNRYNEIGLNLVDVVGWNLYQGWYGGELKEFNKWCENQHERYPDKPMIISEWGAGSDRRLHSDASRAFDFSIEYQQKYIEHYLPFIEQTPWISGSSYWNYIDFNVAGRQESMPRVNNKGLFYNDRTPKDVAYYFKAMWRKDQPVVHIASRDHATRQGDAGSQHAIKVYANTPNVELLLNGRSLGTKTVDNCHAIFSVELPEGESLLTARGSLDGREANDGMIIARQPTPSLAKGEELAINVGSNCNFTSTTSDLTWLADRPFAEGGWGYVEGKTRSTTSEITLTHETPLYQTGLEGNSEYRITAPLGTYEVEILTTDLSRPAAQQAYLLGKDGDQQRTADTTFDITICGKVVERDFCPSAGNRHLTAVKKRYVVDNTDGVITVRLDAKTGNPLLAGLKVRKQ